MKPICKDYFSNLEVYRNNLQDLVDEYWTDLQNRNVIITSQNMDKLIIKFYETQVKKRQESLFKGDFK